MVDYRKTVDDIRAFLRAADLTRQEHMRQLAGAYAEACEAVNARLAVCEDLLQRGMKKEAALLAQVEPPLVDAFAALEFAERNMWEQLAGTFNLPRPAKLRGSVVDALRKEVAVQRQRPGPISPLTARPVSVGTAQPLAAVPLIAEPGPEPAFVSRFPVVPLVVGLLVGIIFTASVAIVIKLTTEKERPDAREEENNTLRAELEQERQKFALLAQEKKLVDDAHRILMGTHQILRSEHENLNKQLKELSAGSMSQAKQIASLKSDIQNLTNEFQRNIAQTTTRLRSADLLLKSISSEFKSHKALAAWFDKVQADPNERLVAEFGKHLADWRDYIANAELSAYTELGRNTKLGESFDKALNGFKEFDDLIRKKDPKATPFLLAEANKAYMEYAKTHYQPFATKHAGTYAERRLREKKSELDALRSKYISEK